MCDKRKVVCGLWLPVGRLRWTKRVGHDITVEGCRPPPRVVLKTVENFFDSCPDHFLGAPTFGHDYADMTKAEQRETLQTALDRYNLSAVNPALLLTGKPVPMRRPAASSDAGSNPKHSDDETLKPSDNGFRISSSEAFPKVLGHHVPRISAELFRKQGVAAGSRGGAVGTATSKGGVGSLAAGTAKGGLVPTGTSTGGVVPAGTSKGGVVPTEGKTRLQQNSSKANIVKKSSFFWSSTFDGSVPQKSGQTVSPLWLAAENLSKNAENSGPGVLELLLSAAEEWFLHDIVEGGVRTKFEKKGRRKLWKKFRLLRKRARRAAWGVRKWVSSSYVGGVAVDKEEEERSVVGEDLVGGGVAGASEPGKKKSPSAKSKSPPKNSSDDRNPKNGLSYDSEDEVIVLSDSEDEVIEVSDDDEPGAAVVDSVAAPTAAASTAAAAGSVGPTAAAPPTISPPQQPVQSPPAISPPTAPQTLSTRKSRAETRFSFRHYLRAARRHHSKYLCMKYNDPTATSSSRRGNKILRNRKRFFATLVANEFLAQMQKKLRDSLLESLEECGEGKHSRDSIDNAWKHKYVVLRQFMNANPEGLGILMMMTGESEYDDGSRGCGWYDWWKRGVPDSIKHYFVSRDQSCGNK